MVTEIPESTWRKLFEAASHFQEMAPWQWTYDAHLFGVEDPETGETGYCSVMGNRGDFFGLAVYPGAAGLRSFEMLNAGDETDEEAVFHQTCLLISFRPAEDLDPDDQALLKMLRIDAIPGKLVPVFRSYQPGFFPWSPSADEIRVMIHALEQAEEVCLQIRGNRDFLNHPEHQGEILVRKVSGGSWQDTWQILPQSHKFRTETAVLDKKAIGDVLLKLPVKPAMLYFEQFFVPKPAQLESDPRPFFPKGVLMLNLETQEIQGFAAIHPGNFREEAPQMLLKFFTDWEYIPQQIIVASDENYKFLREFARLLSIEIHLEKELDIIEEVKKELFEMIGIQ